MRAAAMLMLVSAGAGALLAIARNPAPAQALAAGARVVIGSETKIVGQTAVAQLEIEKVAAPGLGAWTVDIGYDPSIVTATGCTATPGGVCNPTYAGGAARVAGASDVGLQGDTPLGAFEFRCDSTGVSALTLTVIVLADATVGTPRAISATVLHGEIICAGPGDVDCSGDVSPIDALLILQLTAGLIAYLPCQQNANVNGDGLVNAIDAQLILQYVAELIPSLPV